MIQSILIICRFYIWEFTYYSDLPVTKIRPHSTFVVIWYMSQWQKSKSLDEHVPSCSHQVTISLLLHFPYCKQVSFHDLFATIFFTVLCFSVVISLFPIASQTLVLNCYLVFLSKKAVMCMRRKYMLAKFCSGMDYSAVGYEFNVYESTIYIQ